MLLSPSQLSLAQAAAERALPFLEHQSPTVPGRLLRYLWFDGDAIDVISALARYQNEDGGFGNRLEPDIHHPSSNPFAARIAMQYLSVLPADLTTEIRTALQSWLENNQHPDGDWHLSADTRSGFLQPWFAAWEHPSLNPACCIAGLAASIGIATEPMLAKVAVLFQQKASITEIQTGEFYNLLPYVEYSGGVELPNATSWYDAIATRIVDMLEAGALEDAEHFFTLAIGGSPEITKRIPASIISEQIDRMLAEQQGDGGWPTPYDDAWRPWTTAGNLRTLARLREL